MRVFPEDTEMVLRARVGLEIKRLEAGAQRRDVVQRLKNALQESKPHDPTLWRIGLLEGGVQGHPHWQVTGVRSVRAASLREAKQFWFETSGYPVEHWNPETQQWWGWDVVEV